MPGPRSRTCTPSIYPERPADGSNWAPGRCRAPRAAAAAVSVTPAFGIGNQPDFRAPVFRHRRGRKPRTGVGRISTSTLANPASNACLLYYSAATNQINLLGDNGTTWQAVTLATATTLQNSQCSVNVATATVVRKRQHLHVECADDV